jgi:hypothetical protein
MSKKKKSPSRAQYHAPTLSPIELPEPTASKPRLAASRDAWSGESRGAVFLTVGWMFSLLATMLSLLLWLGVWLYVSRYADSFADNDREARQFREWANVIWTYATLFALATGLITLVLGVVVNRIRNKPAPASIRRLSGIVGALPWAIYVALFVMK